ncbi:MAG: nicotinate (nicotinamide) nucleotide adenylyltransferase [Lachnospiraceae bacterium]|nr:nicotinate (nicotinamide) nucleotide adenylyltransferase [Lachnospiraceae bacterium]
MKKTGIMGGSFNPIHNGHLEIAACAKKEYELDEILFIPNNCPPHKDSSEMIDASMRLEMVRLAIAPYPYCTLSDMEIQKGGLSFSYLTVTELKERHPDTEFYFLMGADSLEEFPKWRRAQIIAQKCHILAAMRGELGNMEVKKLAKELSETYHGDFSLLKIPPTDISSTQLRRDLKSQKSITGKVPKAVEDYITDHQLYR